MRTVQFMPRWERPPIKVRSEGVPLQHDPQDQFCVASIVIEAHVVAAPPSFKERDGNHVLGKLPRPGLTKGVAEHSIRVVVVDLREPVRITVERSKPTRVVSYLSRLERAHIKNCPLGVSCCTISSPTTDRAAVLVALILTPCTGNTHAGSGSVGPRLATTDVEATHPKGRR